jgi:hypothetical protein
MKHTDFYAQYKAVRDAERKELIAAIKAHGGKYSFVGGSDEKPEYDINELPRVLASCKYDDTSEQYCVTKVEVETINDNDHLRVYGFYSDYGSVFNTNTLLDIEFGYLSYIIDALPEPTITI